MLSGKGSLSFEHEELQQPKGSLSFPGPDRAHQGFREGLCLLLVSSPQCCPSPAGKEHLTPPAVLWHVIVVIFANFLISQHGFRQPKNQKQCHVTYNLSSLTFQIRLQKIIVTIFHVGIWDFIFFEAHEQVFFESKGNNFSKEYSLPPEDSNFSKEQIFT